MELDGPQHPAGRAGHGSDRLASSAGPGSWRSSAGWRLARPCFIPAASRPVFTRSSPARSGSYVSTRSGREAVLQLASAGDTLAEASLFSATTNAMPCCIRDGCDPVGVSQAALLADPAQPKSARSFAAMLAHQVMTLRTRLERRNIHSARDRVRQIPTVNLVSTDRLSCCRERSKQLAADLGLTHEALYRTLARMESEREITRIPARRSKSAGRDNQHCSLCTAAGSCAHAVTWANDSPFALQLGGSLGGRLSGACRADVVQSHQLSPDAAIGLEKRPTWRPAAGFVSIRANAAVVDSALDGDMVYVHARTPPVYGSAPMPQAGHAELAFATVTSNTVDRAAARRPSRRASLPRSHPISANGPPVNLAEEADYDDAQARLAGIQRLLAIAGYDAYPIDGAPAPRRKPRLNKFLTTASCRPMRYRSRNSSMPWLNAAAMRKVPAFPRARRTTPATASLGDRETGALVTRLASLAAANACGRTCTGICTGARQLCRGGRRQWPHDHARRCAAFLGRRVALARATASSSSPTTRTARRAA